MRFRLRWHFAAVAALTLGLTACDLNPQPEVPSDTEPDDDIGAAGATGEDTPLPGDPAPELGASSASKSSADGRDEPGRETGFTEDDANEGADGRPTAGGGRVDEPGPEDRDAGAAEPPDAAGTVAM